METTILYWGYIGIMENKMETTIVYSVQVMVDKACKVVVCGGGDGTVTSCSAASKIRVMVSRLSSFPVWQLIAQRSAVMMFRLARTLNHDFLRFPGPWEFSSGLLEGHGVPTLEIWPSSLSIDLPPPMDLWSRCSSTTCSRNMS